SHSGESRPAVIIGGAREPAAWEAYPDHEYIATDAEVSCAHCWKPTHIPLPDRRNFSRSLCREVRNGLPLCMDRITAEAAIERFDRLREDGRLRVLSSRFYSFAGQAQERAAKASPYDRE